MSNKRTTVKLAQSAIFVALMIVSAYISIPTPFVPLTFQTVMAVLAGILLGPWYGSAAVGVYVLMGLIGLPVFAHGGGFMYVVNLTFGYLLGFVAGAFVAGLISARKNLTMRRAITAAMAGFAVNYLIGIPYFACIWTFYMHNGELWNAIVVNNLFYMPKDFVLCVLAAVLAVRVYPLINRQPVALSEYREKAVEKKNDK